MRQGTCARCGQDGRLQARNLCGRCYQSLWQSKRLDRFPPVGRVPTERRVSRRPIDWKAIADERKGEIDRLRARIAELEKGEAQRAEHRASVEATVEEMLP